ncbi:MAG: HigA family addiction module antidote protein [Treponema sp.]|jgi:addiction module HigA family antidote|nr:HigA family addiction module antidote protein [Treponema sp.]
MPKNLITSPAVILKEKFMDPFQLKPAALAKGIHTNPAVISNVLNGRQRITIPLALRLAKYFKTPDTYWTDLQFQYDVSRITSDPKFKAAIKEIKAVEKPKPVKAVAAKKAVKKAPVQKGTEEKTKSSPAKRSRKVETPL